MNAKEIRRLAQRINYDKPVNIIFTQTKQRAWVKYKTVYLSRNVKNSFEIVELLYHEIGHIRTTHASLTMQEYAAHMWAINRANQMGQTQCAKRLLQDFTYWLDFDWNSDQRRYVLAAKLFFKLAVWKKRSVM